MKSKVVCGRHDCKFNNNSACTLKAICIGRDMLCQSFFRKNENDYPETVSQFNIDSTEYSNVSNNSNLKIYPNK